MDPSNDSKASTPPHSVTCCGSPPAAGTFQIWKPETFEAEDAAYAEELGGDIPEGTDPLDALDLMLDQREDL